MDLEIFLIFTLTTAIVILSPGPTAVMVAAHGASNGARRAVAGLFGITCATALYFTLSATGIASLIVASHTLFQIIKWAGVSYLIYLGISALLSRSGGLIVPKPSQDAPQRSFKLLYLQGFLVEFANPKALLYFSAILPQFLNLESAMAPQFLTMGVVTFFMQIGIYGGYALLGDRLTKGRVKAWLVTLINKVAGAALIFAGIRMAAVTASK